MINHGLFRNRDVKPATDESLLASVLRAIKGSPDLKRAVEEEERLASQADRRIEIVKRLRDEKARIDEQLLRLVDAERAAFKQLQTIEPTYEAIAATWKKAKSNLDRAQYEARETKRRLLNDLQQNADPIIDETLQKLRALWSDFVYDRMKYALPQSAARKEMRGIPGEYTFLTNYPSLERWKAAVLLGLEKLEQMKTDPDQENLAERCNSFLDLPDWSQVVEVKIVSGQIVSEKVVTL